MLRTIFALALVLKMSLASLRNIERHPQSVVFLLPRSTDRVLIARSPKNPKKKGSSASRGSQVRPSTSTTGSPGSITSSPPSMRNISSREADLLAFVHGQSAAGSSRATRRASARESGGVSTVGSPSTSPRSASLMNQMSGPEASQLLQNLSPAQSYQEWLAKQNQIDAYIRSFQRTNIHPNMEEIEAAKRAKEKASRLRRTADESRRIATALSDRHAPDNPEVMRAMVQSSADSKAALKAMEDHIIAQSDAMVQSIGTTHHDNAAGLSHAASRQAARSRSREAHQDAFAAEYGARYAKARAEKKRPDSPTRAAAYGDAITMKKTAQNTARRYYCYYDEYLDTTHNIYTSGSSSSDEEWTLRDTPRRG